MKLRQDAEQVISHLHIERIELGRTIQDNPREAGVIHLAQRRGFTRSVTRFTSRNGIARI